MSDLIKRSDAIKDLCDISNNSDMPEDWHKGLSVAISALYRVSSADRPQGEWIESFKPMNLWTGFVHDGWSCSICSEVVEKRYPNCPYCLARMKGADDE